MRPTRVWLADPQTLFREGLKALLASCDAVETVADVADPEEVAGRLNAPMLAEMVPDLVLMEVDRVAAQAIRQARPGVRIAFLTDRQDDRALHDYREAGAHAYILKSVSVRELLDAVRIVHESGAWVSPEVANRVPHTAVRPRQAVLTAREQEVLKMTAEGLSVKEVAVALDLSAKTVDAHKVNLMRKLRIHNKAQLVQYAYENQILKLEYRARA